MSKEIIIKTKRTTNYVYLNDKGSDIPMVFLHGFTGSHRSWGKVVEKLGCTVVTLDLPGHGKSLFISLNLDYCIDDWCEDFNQISDFLDISKIDLCGYSMGGRLAIAFASKYPEKINKLVLESASYGIEDKKVKEERFKGDLEQCQLIEEDLPLFVRKWENNELFLNQKNRNPQGFLDQQKQRLSHNSKQLSKSLKSFSQGNMRFYKNEFLNFKFPVILINGSEDSRYIKIGNDIKSVNKAINQYIIEECGHNTHIEKPNSFRSALGISF